MSITPVYTTSAIATGGRDGHARTLDDRFRVTLAVPREMGGNGAGNNPEQLFAAGYAACFIGALKAAAAADKALPRVPADTSVTSTVGIGPRAEGGFGLTVALAVSLPGIDHAAAEPLVAAAHQICPYSNATRGNIDVALTIA
jgi:Ohr subfamily peroxiredoxin